MSPLYYVALAEVPGAAREQKWTPRIQRGPACTWGLGSGSGLGEGGSHGMPTVCQALRGLSGPSFSLEPHPALLSLPLLSSQ